jgi:hypothetical protein
VKYITASCASSTNDARGVPHPIKLLMFSHLHEMPSVQSFGNVKNPDTFAYGSSVRIVADNLSARLAEPLIFSRIEFRNAYLSGESSVSGRIQLFVRRTQPSHKERRAQFSALIRYSGAATIFEGVGLVCASVTDCTARRKSSGAWMFANSSFVPPLPVTSMSPYPNIRPTKL